MLEFASIMGVPPKDTLHPVRGMDVSKAVQERTYTTDGAAEMLAACTPATSERVQKVLGRPVGHDNVDIGWDIGSRCGSINGI